ncbi:hypothetical protein NMY22_g8595 [Coprinellus aureogranulatus]|nr:hypothetical protein NMY22_g8595 [Coprinellus aureogranulatus]
MHLRPGGGISTASPTAQCPLICPITSQRFPTQALTSYLKMQCAFRLLSRTNAPLSNILAIANCIIPKLSLCWHLPSAFGRWSPGLSCAPNALEDRETTSTLDLLVSHDQHSSNVICGVYPLSRALIQPEAFMGLSRVALPSSSVRCRGHSLFSSRESFPGAEPIDGAMVATLVPYKTENASTDVPLFPGHVCTFEVIGAVHISGRFGEPIDAAVEDTEIRVITGTNSRAALYGQGLQPGSAQ